MPISDFGYSMTAHFLTIPVAKKYGVINTSIITVLKDMINKNSNATVGQITYTDLDS